MKEKTVQAQHEMELQFENPIIPCNGIEDAKEPSTVDGGGEPANAPSPSMNAGVHFTLLGTQVAAIVEISGNDKKVLVLPTETSGGSMTLDDFLTSMGNLVRECTKADFETTSLTTAIGKFVNTEATSVTLRQLYLYWDSSSKVFEYAINIEIGQKPSTDSTALPSIFSVEKVSFAIWSTSRAKILERMSMGSIQDMLEEPS